MTVIKGCLSGVGSRGQRGDCPPTFGNWGGAMPPPPPFLALQFTIYGKIPSHKKKKNCKLSVRKARECTRKHKKT